MDSNEIFKYSNNFLEEIKENLLELRIKKKANPQNLDYDNNLKTIMGRNLDEIELKNLIGIKDIDFKKDYLLIESANIVNDYLNLNKKILVSKVE